MATLQHTDELYHILEDEICALKILPGEALSENQLCKRFGVSRTPIRSVLQRLEQNRFVQIIPCKGPSSPPLILAWWISSSSSVLRWRAWCSGILCRAARPWRSLR